MKSVYLNDIPLEQALKVFQEALEAHGLDKPFAWEEIELSQALGRTLAEPVWADRSLPHYHAAAMDGFAIRAADTDGATDRAPVTLQVTDQATYVDTGDLMPEWADAVVPIENVEAADNGDDPRQAEAIRLRAGLAPWSHVRPMGEDMVATELVLPAGATLRPADLGAIAGSGHASVKVWRRPRVAILPTGTELVPLGTDAQPGQIVEFNSLVLAAQVKDWGGTPHRLKIVADKYDQIRQVVAQAVQNHDLVLINAGSSAGSEDFTARVVEDLGTLLVHGVAVRPGHPVILGTLDRHTSQQMQVNQAIGEAGLADEPPPPGETIPAIVPVIGVPGYPVSAALTGEIFVEPLLARWQGRQQAQPETLKASITRKVHSSLGDDEYLRVTVGRVGERLVAAPLSRGAGVITSLVRADGLVIIPSGQQGLEAGQEVDVQLYRNLDDIERTIMILGSHDLTIDIMAQFLSPRGARLASANLGSLGGLMALRRGEAHLAGSHLLDPETGEYNLSYIQRYLPDTPVVVVSLVNRQQGLILPAGNPKEIKSLDDLARDDVSFINRQRGAGTRILLDYHLEQLGLQPEQIKGYQREEYTHLSVAASIASGRADCGLGIRAAAKALDLDFITLFDERYDLVIPKVYYESDKLKPLLMLLDDFEFKQYVADMPGYDVGPMGKIVAKIP
ncbi:MAG: molybdopterin biosynthesis protein [Anaerolineales bacterium]|jgi:putative molybdopterin biosynthesis protein